ncbi:ANTAR domain-containing response regulator [Paenibacillus abyssi]|uniref:ANTAR domain-containing protein n=1 Tax=Paenibacillus abyssi TaxID=1340531 RepID=A0A917FP45_9BACL|nr:ANTAR domain-containing protein [Paenibacillus abyssi]GGF92145.1 hypothetical protein GCM10010916_06890 [Paenibacillus abyssi]
MLKAIMLVEEAAKLITLHSLRQNCRTLHTARTDHEMRSLVSVVDAVVLHVPLERMLEWQAAVSGIRRLPLLWICNESEFPKEMDWGYTLDGVLYPSMTTTEMQFALKWGIRTHHQRKRWMEEREQLLQRLEERKWIDQAKAVLCEIKGISEAEAYDFLRKQAMNERKRIGDIAASIVKVYQLIHG